MIFTRLQQIINDFNEKISWKNITNVEYMKTIVVISFKTIYRIIKFESKTSETTNKLNIFFQIYKIPFKLFLSKFKFFLNLQFHFGGKKE